MESLYSLRPQACLQQFRKESFAFWMICGYLFVEYVRPQSIFPAIDFLPWASLFLLLSLIGLFFERGRKWTSAPTNKWMFLFFVVILLSSWNAYFPKISYRNLDYFYTWFIIYFLIINIVTTPERFFIFLAIFVLASFKISLSLAITWAKRGFAFTDWGLMGPPGFFQNSGELAIQMAVFFPVAYVSAVALRPYVSRWAFYILALMPVTAAMTILGSSSRGGQLALVVQIVLMFWRQLFKPKVFVVVAAVAVILFVLLPEEQKERFANAGDDRTSQQRLNYWSRGLDMMNDHPVLGIGYFNFPTYFETYHRDAMLYPHAELAHNIFIQVGADLGYVGLFLYVMLMVNGFVRMPAKERAGEVGGGVLRLFGGALNISLVGFLVAGQFVSVVYYPFLWIHLAFVVAWKKVCFSST